MSEILLEKERTYKKEVKNFLKKEEELKKKNR